MFKKSNSINICLYTTRKQKVVSENIIVLHCNWRESLIKYYIRFYSCFFFTVQFFLQYVQDKSIFSYKVCFLGKFFYCRYCSCSDTDKNKYIYDFSPNPPWTYLTNCREHGYRVAALFECFN